MNRISNRTGSSLLCVATAAALLCAAPCQGQEGRGSRSHVFGNSTAGGSAASAARVYRTTSGAYTTGGVELSLHNRAHNGVGSREIGRVGIYGGQLESSSSATAGEYGLMTVDVGGYRTFTQWFSRLNSFDVYRFFDTGWVGSNTQFSFLFSFASEARLYGAVQTRVNLSTQPSFGIWGNAWAWSYARGDTWGSTMFAGAGKTLESTEIYGNLQTQVNAHITDRAYGIAVHRSQPTHVEFLERTMAFWSTWSRYYPILIYGPGIAETWFNF